MLTHTLIQASETALIHSMHLEVNDELKDQVSAAMPDASSKDFLAFYGRVLTKRIANYVPSRHEDDYGL